MANTNNHTRYIDQIAVLGEAGQRRLGRTRVHIAGLGGLGSNVALLLSQLGVGRISANDPQVVEPSNLSRFILGDAADLGKFKVEVAARHLARWPALGFTPLVAPNESSATECMIALAGWVFSCANTVEARVAAARMAVQTGTSIIDVGVADGRELLAGTVKIWRPSFPSWAACPACTLPSRAPTKRREGWLFSVIALTASISVQLFVEHACRGRRKPQLANMLTLDAERFTIESAAINRSPYCRACADVSGGASIHKPANTAALVAGVTTPAELSSSWLEADCHVQGV